MKIKTWFFIFYFTGLSLNIAAAAPSVSGISGTVTHGETLTVSGSNFTTFSTTVYTVDRVEAGSFSGDWNSTNDLTATNSPTQRNSNSVYLASANATSQSVADMRFQAGSTVARTWYVEYWWKLGSDWDFGTSGFGGTDKFLANIKVVRFWNPGSFLENVYVQYKGDTNAVEFLPEAISGDPVYEAIGSARTALTLNTWHKFQFEFRDSSSAGQHDGEFNMWFDDGGVTYSSTTAIFKEDEDVNKRPFIIGWQNEWDCNEGTPDSSGCDGDNSLYIDDVVMQDTWARVEIGDNASYDSCTIREYQKVLSWSASSIQIEYNEGSLTGTNYLFVIDSNGDVSSGFEVGAGGGGGGGTPATTTGSMPVGDFTLSGGATYQ